MYCLAKKQNTEQGKAKPSRVRERRTHAQIGGLQNKPRSRNSRPSAEDEFEQGSFQPAPSTHVETCACCFDQVTFHGRNTNVCSTGKHHFCECCVKRYAESFLAGEPYPLRDNGELFNALPCLSPDCMGGFMGHSVFQNVINGYLWENYQEKIIRLTEIERMDETSAIGGASNKGGDLTWYTNDSSRTCTRTHCSDETSCREAEEALTEAKLRRCPECNAPFLKQSGCNKIKCPSCYTVTCYICRKRVPRRGYDHFCQHDYDQCSVGCGKCPLWTTMDDLIDSQRMMEVLDEANEKWEDLLLNGGPEGLGTAMLEKVKSH